MFSNSMDDNNSMKDLLFYKTSSNHEHLKKKKKRIRLSFSQQYFIRESHNLFLHRVIHISAVESKPIGPRRSVSLRT